MKKKGDVIENRHSGIPTMRREMNNYGLPEPEFYEERDSFKVIFRNTNVFQHGTQIGTQIGIQTETQYDTQITNDKLNKIKLIVLDYCMEPRTSEEIRKYINMEAKSTFSRNIIKPLINEGKLDYTNKNSVNAKNQKYVTIVNKEPKN